MIIVETLRKLSLFGGFDQSELEELARRSRPCEFGNGETIVRQGDFDASMFVIVSGKAKVTFYAPGGMQEITTLGQGDVVGEISLLTGVARTATVTAVGPVSAIEIGKTAFSAVVAGRKPLLEHIASIVEQRRAEIAYVKQEAQRASFQTQEGLLDKLVRLFG